ncbi:MAG: exosortase-associated protein EpsI, B-type [Methylophilaceae bacterium]
MKISLTNMVLLIVMLASSGAAIALRPTRSIANEAPSVQLETLIPKQFADWRVDDLPMPIVSPELQAALNKVYAQTLTRTYINTRGERVMLSIAYGRDQSDNLQVHLPEGCYQGQGFAVEQKVRGTFDTAYGSVPVVRLVARKSLRVEPITYWITVGNEAVQDGWGMKKAKLAFAFKGEVPDGMLVRVSTITQDVKSAYQLQEGFAEALLANVSSEQRLRLIGFK